MKNFASIAAALSVAFLSADALAQSKGTLPKRPEDLAYRPLVFNPPKASDYRHVLPSGVVVYLAPSKELPLVDLVMTFKGGQYLESADKVGLSGMTAELMRTGGTGSLGAQGCIRNAGDRHRPGWRHRRCR